jgi:putative DNA primase/helicase
MTALQQTGMSRHGDTTGFGPDEVAVDRLAIRDFLSGMYGFDAPGYLTPCWKVDGGLGCEFVPAGDLETVVDVLVRRAQHVDTWIGMGSRRVRLGAGRRGGAADVLASPSVWLDVDYIDDGHRGTEGLAVDLAHASLVVASMPLRPTVVIATGGGVQAHWCFPKPALVDDCAIPLADLCEGWVRVAQAHAAASGAPNAADSVGNIDRILRVPGTLNHKLDRPRPITIIEVDWDRRYTLEVIDRTIPPSVRATRAPSRHALAAGSSNLYGVRPLDDFDTRTDIATLIEPDGATYAYTDPDGRRHYTRPGKDVKDGVSGNVLDNKLYVHSDAWVANAVTLEPNRAYTPSQYLTFTRFGGDFSAAARSVAARKAKTVEQYAQNENVGSERSLHTERLLVASPADPLPNARLFATARYAHPEQCTLLNHQDTFETWTGTHWRPFPDENMRSDLYEFFEDTVFFNANGELRPFSPQKSKIASLVEALRAHTQAAPDLRAPAWLTDAATDVGATEVIPMANGLLHVPTRRLLSATPTLYTTWALPFAYDSTAPAPTRWLTFLNELWPDDHEAHDTLQEIFGYVLSGDTRQQKLFALIGAKRAGKGTIARVLTALVGTDNVAGPTVASLAERFGLAPLVGRPLAIMSDARLESKNFAVVERLLAISGEDRISIERKYKDAQELRLPTRFLLISNETPRFTDSSGAIASRFVILHLVRSFYGAEDINLTDTLLWELPGIFNWTLDGLDRLRTRGHFLVPASSHAIAQELADVSSPIGSFVRDRCEVSRGREVACTALHHAYREWCHAEGFEPEGIAEFGRKLRTVVPGLQVPQRRQEGQRLRVYKGISLASLLDA